MASPTRFLSGRQQEQKIGIEGSTDNKKVLEVVGRVGIGTTIFEPTSELEVRGDVIVSGILTVSNIVVTSAAGGVFEIDKLRVTGISTFVGISSFENNLSVGGNLDVDGHTELDDVNVSGASTFAGAIDANGSLDVDGHTELDNLNVSGVSTFIGVSTFQSDLNIGGNLEVDGHTELDDLNVSGVSTFASAIVGSAVTISSSGINVAAGIITGTLDNNLTLATSGTGLSGSATYNNSGVVTFTVASNATDANTASTIVSRNGSGNFSAGTISADLTGVASTATKLATSRTFELTGDVVASTISFDGTGNVSLAATIQPNSVGLGTDTTGDYVSSISGTSNEIAVSSGTGEGSTPTISFVTNPTIGGNVTIGSDLQVNNNLNVTGNITVGGTSATLFTETLRVKDADIVLGFTTNSSGNEVSTDTTANNGGIAIASTEGSPIVSFNIDSIPSTYKNIMWFKTNAFTGLNTDAWLTNYSFGVGTTSMSAGTKFAVGNIEADFDDITSVRHIKSSGIVTASSFSGDGSGLFGISGGTAFAENSANQSQTIPFYVSTATTDVAGVSTQSFVFNPSTKSLGIGTDAPTSNLHVEGTLNISGVSTFGNNIDANGDLDVDGHTELDNVNVSGVSTFSDDVRFVGAANTDVVWDKSANSLNFEDYAKATFGDGGDLTITHSSNQSSISESSGSGLEVKSVKVTITPNGSTEKMAEFNANSSVELYFDDSKKLETTGYGITVTGDVNTSNNISIAGVSTFAGAIDANGDLDVDGHTELDNLNVSGVSTFAGAIDANGSLDVDGHTELDNVNVSGVSTFTGAIDANGSLDVDGHTELDNVNVSGVSTFAGSIDANGSLDVDGHTELDDLNVSGVSTFASAIVGSAVTISSSGINAATGIITASSLDAAISEWVLGADGTDNYTFSGPGFTGAENDPTIYVVRGQKYNFENKMGAHPFRIQSDPNGSTGTQYNDGITNNDVSNGTLVWDVQFDAPGALYYQCTSHANMGGRIYTRSDAEDSISFNTIIVGGGTTITGSGINAPTGIITATSFIGSGALLTGVNSGITIREEGSVAGSASSVGDINFVSSNLTATASGIGATVTLSDTPTFTSTVIGTGVTVNSSGINATGVITATSFSGSGANLTGIAVGQVIGALSGLTIREEGSVAGSASSVGDINFVSSNLTASASGVGATVTLSDAPTFSSIVIGTGVTINSSGINATGVITATSFSGSGANLTGIAVGQVIGALSGLTIREEGSVAGSASSVVDIDFVSSNLTATASGVGATVTLTDTPTFTSTVIGTGVTINSSGINATGVITATSFSGSGANLTGIAVGQVIGALSGLTIRDEASIVGSASSVGDINFVSSNLTATASGVGATVTLTDTPTFTSTVIGTGVTINSSGINAATGIITASSLDAAISEWVLGADGTDNYTFTGPGLTGAENDPSIYLVRGQKYNFKNSSGGHPFRIQSTPNGSTGTQYNDGITNNDAGNGTTLNWNVQFDAPEVLYYQCTSHGSMGGKIYIGNSGESIIVGAAVTINSSGINATGVITATSFSGSGANLTNIPAPDVVTGDKYNTGITTSIYVSITGGIGTAVSGLTTVAANNDIFIGPGIGYSFPSTAGKSYIIESIHVTNIYNTHLYLTSRHDFNGGENVPTAQRVIVPYQGALEVLEEPIIAKPSDILRFQAFAGIGETSGVGPEAVGVNNGLDSFITYSEKTDTNFIGTGKTIVTPAGTELFTSNTNSSVIQSIRLCNYDLDFDVDASVSIYRGGSVGGILTTGVRHGYLVYNLTVPKNSVIEILERPKYLAANDTVVVGVAGTTLTNSLSSTLSGKYIT